MLLSSFSTIQKSFVVSLKKKTSQGQRLKIIIGFYIIIHGIAKCHWTEHRSRSVGTGKNRRTEHYTVSYDGNQTFLNSKTYLFGRSGADAIEMQPGTFSYNFACELPLLLPETLAASHGSIAYSVEAVLDIPWRFDKEIQTYFTVVRHDNLNDYPELRMAQRQEEIKTFCCLFCQSGPCMLTVTIPYGGYAAGQTIPIKIEYCNQSNVDVERTRIRLKRFTNFTSQTPETKTKSEKMDVVQIMVDGVKQGTNNNMECSLLLPSILVSSNGRFCRVVRTEYVLQVEGVVGDCHSNPKINIPIEIGRVAIADFVQQPTTYFPQQPIVAPTAPLVDINSIDLREFFHYL